MKCPECGKEYTDADMARDEDLRRPKPLSVRLKSEVVEARQYTQAFRVDIAEWCSGLFPKYGPFNAMNLTDRHGTVRIVEYSDWILKGQKGFEVITDDEYETLYEEVK